jgi:ELL-associated factor
LLFFQKHSFIADDFKPASVDVHKEATLQTGSNNSVTVTLPHLGMLKYNNNKINLSLFLPYALRVIMKYSSDGSGVPNTTFKGNQRDYTKKECILIINRDTNEITLERLHGNIQVKKTRTDSSSSKQQSGPSTAPVLALTPQQQQQPGIERKVENQTARHSSKTRVSTGVRKNNILNFVPKHSPSQGSPSYPHRSPQQAPS